MYDLAAKYIQLGAHFKELNDLDLAHHNFKQALRTKYEQGATAAEQILKPAIILQELGNVAYKQQRYKETFRFHKMCLQHQLRNAAGPLELARAYHNVAHSLQDPSKFEQAFANYQEALKIRAVLAPDSMDLASTYHNLGILCRQRPERLSEALKYSILALETEQRQSPNSAGLAATLP
jgi:tetratricopeptide (TPR) repeat protein